jgi:hypothetical protein
VGARGAWYHARDASSMRWNRERVGDLDRLVCLLKDSEKGGTNGDGHVAQAGRATHDTSILSCLPRFVKIGVPRSTGALQVQQCIVLEYPALSCRARAWRGICGVRDRRPIRLDDWLWLCDICRACMAVRTPGGAVGTICSVRSPSKTGASHRASG